MFLGLFYLTLIFALKFAATADQQNSLVRYIMSTAQSKLDYFSMEFIIMGISLLFISKTLVHKEQSN